MGLQWRDQLSVGNDLIDSDHKHLIEVTNRAELSLKAGNRVALASVLQELSGYAKSHFDREELISQAVDCCSDSRDITSVRFAAINSIKPRTDYSPMTPEYSTRTYLSDKPASGDTCQSTDAPTGRASAHHGA